MLDLGALMPRGGLVAIQREQAALMKQPMVGTTMVGDPRMALSPGAGGAFAWRVGQYAAAMEARFEPPATVVFTLPMPPPDFNRQADLPVEIARFTVPARVLAYDPYARPLQQITGP